MIDHLIRGHGVLQGYTRILDSFDVDVELASAIAHAHPDIPLDPLGAKDVRDLAARLVIDYDQWKSDTNDVLNTPILKLDRDIASVYHTLEPIFASFGDRSSFWSTSDWYRAFIPDEMFALFMDKLGTGQEGVVETVGLTKSITIQDGQDLLTLKSLDTEQQFSLTMQRGQTLCERVIGAGGHRADRRIDFDANTHMHLTSYRDDHQLDIHNIEGPYTGPVFWGASEQGISHEQRHYSSGIYRTTEACKVHPNLGLLEHEDGNEFVSFYDIVRHMDAIVHARLRDTQ